VTGDQLTPAPRRRVRHPESVEQRSFIERWRLNPTTSSWPACAIPNGGRRNPREAAILKAEGVSRGAPDWLCFMPGSQRVSGRLAPAVGLALEFKRPDKRVRASPEQVAWHHQLRSCGWRVEIVRSADEAWQVVSETYWLEA
jgi:hypothetical protein